MKVILASDAIRFPLTGIGRYAYELARGLQADASIELRFLSGHRLTADLPSVAETPPVEGRSAVRSRKPHHVMLRSPLAVRAIHFGLDCIKARTLRQNRDSIFHGPNFYLPRFRGPGVVTIHDLSIYLWAHCHPKERVQFMTRAIRTAVKRANLVLTVSEFGRREVLEFFNLPPERVVAIPLASSAEFRPRGESELHPTLQKHGLRFRSYAFYSGTIEPRKNLLVLLRAYSALPLALRRAYPLVLSGFHGWHSEAIHAAIERGKAEGWVNYLGYVAAEELPHLFAGARLFLFPSLYEGFGLPVLEAMASGVPVVCSSAASLPEVAGDAAAMCAADDIDALRCLIETGLEDEQWQQQARAAGLARAAQFSWQRCAEQTVAAYRLAAAD